MSIGDVWHCGVCQAGNYDRDVCRRCGTKREDADLSPVEERFKSEAEKGGANEFLA